MITLELPPFSSTPVWSFFPYECHGSHWIRGRKKKFKGRNSETNLLLNEIPRKDSLPTHSSLSTKMSHPDGTAPLDVVMSSESTSIGDSFQSSFLFLKYTKISRCLRAHWVSHLCYFVLSLDFSNRLWKSPSQKMWDFPNYINKCFHSLGYWLWNLKSFLIKFLLLM